MNYKSRMDCSNSMDEENCLDEAECRSTSTLNLEAESPTPQAFRVQTRNMSRNASSVMIFA